MTSDKHSRGIYKQCAQMCPLLQGLCTDQLLQELQQPIVFGRLNWRIVRIVYAYTITYCKMAVLHDTRELHEVSLCIRADSFFGMEAEVNYCHFPCQNNTVTIPAIYGYH